MSSMRIIAAWLIATMVVVCSVKAADTRSELDSLRKELNDLKRKADAQGAAPVSRSGVERALDNRYGPNASVSTKSGKLTIGGLTQIWFCAYQKDNRGLFDKSGGTAGPDTNEGQDNSTFRIRRAEIKFSMDIHENVSGVVLIDPARESTSFPNPTDNQVNSSIFKTLNQVSPEFDSANGPGLGSTSNIAGIQSGSGSAPRLLKDAYINYHGVIPHHDFQVGQWKFIGEEGTRSSAQLDFVERSFLGQHIDNIQRDLQLVAHGTWWDERFQYWVGAADGAGNYFGTAGQEQNRADDNNEKDFIWRTLVRPLWKQETWGSLELGGSGRLGSHGANHLAARDPIDNPINGLNRERTWASEYNAWLYYAPGGPVRGLWLRGEWLWFKDRNAPNTVADLEGNGVASSAFQGDPKPMSVWGAYGAIGYKISDTCYCDSCNGWLKNFEFCARVDYFTNVLVANSVDPQVTDAYRTIVYTGGINYYIKGHDAKIQLNYNGVRSPDGGNHNFHEGVSVNSFVMNFQVAF